MADDRLVSVAKSLGMSQTPGIMEALRRNIQTELGGLHPGKNGGEFASTEFRERFDQLSAALVELDGGTGTTALVPVETVASTVLEASILAPMLAPAASSNRLPRRTSGTPWVVVSAPSSRCACSAFVT